MLNSAEHEFFLLINVTMPKTVGTVTFMSGINSILGLPEPEKAEFLDIFYSYEHLKVHARLSCMINFFDLFDLGLISNKIATNSEAAY